MGKVKVAFVCVHNSCRSQMAEALTKLFASDVIEAYSAGTESVPAINADAVETVERLYGVDMQKEQYSKTIDKLPIVDIVVTMGCNVQCPYLPAKHREDWGLEDPTGMGRTVFVETAKVIEQKVKRLRERIVNDELM